MIWTETPEIRCRACTKSFQHSAHWEVQLDHELECEHCGAKLKLVCDEIIRRWVWDTVDS